MADRTDLKVRVMDAITAAGGEACLVDVAKHLRNEHETELRASGDLFFTWQHDMRWAATLLRKEGKMGKGGTKAP
ncbi:hypothetical protein [Rhodobaculum claviforme]|uniref:Uncharacterized protein n=1 Tax=Rhodobaculum claviforme TaxID=1549854 RepID=A0A934TLG5_9RHOB|nr:hypothetical protein [Rhodobaculum claviforme]MBK5928310.1 hypothetical protein [Rhodobaculum claviforme]